MSMSEADIRRYLAQQDTPDSEESIRAYLGQPSTDQPGRLASFGRGVAQGATLGFADEGTAGLKAIGAAIVPGGRGFRETFSEEVEESRGQDRAAREAHPRYMLAGDLTGAVGAGVASGGLGLLRGAATAARAGNAARTATSVGRLATQGAGLGALDAAGRAEGNIAERAPEAAFGAAVGGTVGAVLPGLGKGARRLSEATGLFRGSPVTQATDDLLRAFGDDSIPVDGLATRGSGVAGETAMDVGGANVRGLAETANLYPSKGRDQLQTFARERTHGQFPVIQDEIEGAVGFRRQNTGALIDDISSRQAAAAKPLYDEAYQHAVPRAVLGDVDLVNDELFRDAYERGIRIAQRRGEDIRAIVPELIDGAPFAADVQIPVQAIDYMKRGLNDAIRSRIQRGGMAENEGYAVAAQVRGLLRRVDAAVPAYGQARATWAGEEALKEAAQLGRDQFLRGSPGDLMRLVDEMGPSELEGFRRGAVDAVLDQLGNVADRRDLMNHLVQSPNARSRMRLLFDGDDQFNAFMGRMDALRSQGEATVSALGNSRTAGREAMKEAYEGRGIGRINLRSLLDAAGSTRRADVAVEKTDALVPMLLEQDLPGLSRRLTGRAADRARSSETGRALTRGAAAGSSGYLSRLFFGDDQ